MTGGPAPSEEFWAIVAATRPPHGDPEAHADAIVARLVSSGIDETLSFAQAFDEAMSALYTWDLWGVAYLAMGGCSDDAFEHVRAWIVGRGQETWSRAQEDPEGLFIGLLDKATEPERRWEEIGLSRGEHLLYTAGRAHETLTGDWLPANTKMPLGPPAGDDWDEEALNERFPDLVAALPDWWKAGAMAVDTLSVRNRAVGGLDAFIEGDHARAEELLMPIVDNPDQWAHVEADPDLRVGVAYAAGMSRMLRGDVEGAATTLRLVEGDIHRSDEVRRGLAQVELARGELLAASQLLDPTPNAARLDRILTAKVLWRRGDREAALERARQELELPLSEGDHPWDVAGAIQQAGRILVDAGDINSSRAAVTKIVTLISSAPEDLPLVHHLRLLEASVARLEGRPDQALALLESLGGVEGSDYAELLRERARALRELGRSDEAVAEYQASYDSFIAAGEKWEAEATRTEATSR